MYTDISRRQGESCSLPLSVSIPQVESVSQDSSWSCRLPRQLSALLCQQCGQSRRGRSSREEEQESYQTKSVEVHVHFTRGTCNVDAICCTVMYTEGVMVKSEYLMSLSPSVDQVQYYIHVDQHIIV